MTADTILRPLVLAAAVAAGVGGCDGAKSGKLFSPSLLRGNADEFSILLYVLSGANREQRIEGYRAQTEEDAGWKGLFVVHGDALSELYWGRHTSRRAARRNLRKARRYRTPVDIPIYEHARIVEHPNSGKGPTEWDLHNADGVYTVAVAVFYNDEKHKVFNRKRLALAYCKVLREEGQEAYYNHGASKSTVTIGAFPASAIKVEKIRGGTTEQKIIQDERMKQICKKFPHLLVNGKRRQIAVPRLGSTKGQWIDRPSTPVFIPGMKPSGNE